MEVRGALLEKGTFCLWNPLRERHAGYGIAAAQVLKQGRAGHVGEKEIRPTWRKHMEQGEWQEVRLDI